MTDFAMRSEPRLATKTSLRRERPAPALELGKDRALHYPAAVRRRSPTTWWRAGLVALGIVAAILLIFQLLMERPAAIAPDAPPAAMDIAP